MNIVDLRKEGRDLNETLKNETENIKKNHSEMKSSIKIKNTLEGINSRGHRKTGNLEDRIIESNQTEQEREKKNRK